jgi:hypothetical protein
VLLGREQAVSGLKHSETLRKLANIRWAEAQLAEAHVILASLHTAEKYESSQFCLNRAVHLSRLSDFAVSSDVKFDAAAQHVLAKTMWNQGETLTSIQMLQSLSQRTDLNEQHISVSMVEILADLVSVKTEFPERSH